MEPQIKELAKAILESALDELKKMPPIKEEADKIQAVLLPCPHCGSPSADTDEKKAAVFFGGKARTPKYYKIQCYRCNASVEQSSVEAVIKIWNARC